MDWATKESRTSTSRLGLKKQEDTLMGGVLKIMTLKSHPLKTTYRSFSGGLPLAKLSNRATLKHHLRTLDQTTLIVIQ